MRPQRRGLSLTEVLVAMFVMALGLMALLTLFPLGAMQVAQALKDDRTGQVATQADAWVRVWWRDAVIPYKSDPNTLPADGALLGLDDPNVVDGGPSTGGNKIYAAPAIGTTLSLLPYLGSGTNPRLGNPTTSPTPPEPFVVFAPQLSLQNTTVQAATGSPQSRIVATSSGGVTLPSYPVLLDPLGYTATRSGTGSLDRFWVGRNGGQVYGQGTNVPVLLPRRNSSVTGGSTPPTGSSNLAFAACALTDDLTYQPNGAAGTGTEPLGRQGRYHWAALLQRPNDTAPDRANLTVLVFDGRPPFLGITGDEVVLTNNFVNTANPNGFNPPPGGLDGVVNAGDRTLQLFVPTRGADQGQLVRRGAWIAVAALQPGATGVRKVSFHRVTGLTTGDEVFVGGTLRTTPMALDIDPPVPAEFSPGGSPLPVGTVQVYLLAGLTEVFERPVLTR